MYNPLNFRDPAALKPGNRFKEYIKLWKDGKLNLKQGIFDQRGYCTWCHTTAPHHMEKVRCNICCRTYHTPCLLDNLGKSCVAALAWNPCLWWFCLECLWVTEQANGGSNTDSDTRKSDKMASILNVSDESNCSSSDSSCDLMDYYRARNPDYPKHSSENRMMPDFDNVKEGASRSTFAAKSASKTQSPRKLSSASAHSESSESELSALGGPRYKNKVFTDVGPPAKTKSSERPRILISEETRKELLSKTMPPFSHTYESDRPAKKDVDDEVELYKRMFTDYLNSAKCKSSQRPRMLISQETREELLSKTTPPVSKPKRQLFEDVRQFPKTRLKSTQHTFQNDNSSTVKTQLIHKEKSPARKEMTESKESGKNAELSTSSERSPRNLSSSSGFSSSSGSSPAQQKAQKTLPNNQVDVTPKCSKKTGKTNNLKSTDPEHSEKQQSPSKSVNIPDIPRVSMAKSIEIAKARALSPTKFEQRQRNADDLNEIRNLVQRGRNFV